MNRKRKVTTIDVSLTVLVPKAVSRFVLLLLILR